MNNFIENNGRNRDLDVQNIGLLIYNHIYVDNEMFFDEENIKNNEFTKHLANDTYLIEKCHNIVDIFNAGHHEVLNMEIDATFDFI